MPGKSKPRKPSKPPARLIDLEKRAVIDTYTRGATRVIESIRSGKVDELELDKLHNFFVTCVTMMEMVPLATFREAQRIAEVRSLLDTGIKVAMDPKKTGA